MNRNILLCTDTYKLGHMSQFQPGTTKIYSYLTARCGLKIPYTLWYGPQYYLKSYLSRPPTRSNVEEFVDYHERILGHLPSHENIQRLLKLADMGYLPLKIKAVKEGTVMPVKNVLLTITNTHPEFYWLVGFVESLLLKIWNTTTVASYDMSLKVLCQKYAVATCDDNGHLPFQVHDFGYRGVSSEESAALSGSAHLINFLGTDTIPALKLIRDTYGCSEPIGLSVPASEHSVMCSFGQENEFAAFENMLSLYPAGIVSIVSDTYNLWSVLTDFTARLKDRILARDGKVVFRPDSGDPALIICGDPLAKEGSPERKGALRLLDETFGSSVNRKGYRLLNPKVGLIYGDGMYFDRFQRILSNMKEMGYATSNLVVGIGGLLLQQHSRDEQGFTMKATYAEINGKPVELIKDPITDSFKKSHKGLLMLTKDERGSYVTKDQCTPEEEESGLLEVVFENGQMRRTQSFDDIRRIAAKGCPTA